VAIYRVRKSSVEGEGYRRAQVLAEDFLALPKVKEVDYLDLISSGA